MSFKHGKDTGVLLDGANVSGYFNKADLGVDVDTAESTTFGNAWKTFVVGTAAGTYETGGYFDPLWTVPWNDIGSQGKVLTIGPNGVAVGAQVRLVSVLASTYKETAPIGGVVAFDWGIQASGPVGFGRIIAADTATADANGTSFDYTAQTTNGGIAHLHVTSVSASDSIVVTIEDSSTGSSGWATIATFDSAAAVGGQRVTISGTIKRYVRAVYDVTGSGVSISTVVALARL